MAQCPRAEVRIYTHLPQPISSCTIHSDKTGDDQLFDELLLWACFANHQMNNMGRRKQMKFAATLQSLAAETLRHKLHWAAELLFVIAGLGPSKKNFVGTIQQVEGEQKFNLKMNGFGLLGRGLGYYVPQSVLSLLLHTAKQRYRNRAFVICLLEIARTCSQLVLDGRLNLRNAAQLAMETVTRAVVKNAWEAEEPDRPVGSE